MRREVALVYFLAISGAIRDWTKGDPIGVAINLAILAVFSVLWWIR